MQNGGYLLSWVGYKQDDETRSVCPVAWNGFEAGYLESLGITWEDTERGRGPTGTAVRTGRVTIARRIVDDPAFEVWREEALKRGYASSISLPLGAQDSIFGAISIYAVEPDAFDCAEAELLGELADDLTYGIVALRNRQARDEATEQLRRLNEELEARVAKRTAQLERVNAELSSFSYSVAHDLRAPLRSIGGFARILVEDYGQQVPPDALELVERVLKNTRRMDDLIDGLLALSRADRCDVTLEPVPLSALMKDIVEGYSDEIARRHVEVIIGHLPEVHADRTLMRQVMTNLFDNALKFTRHREHARVEIGCEVCENRRSVYVSDNGAGFAMKNATGLFGLFQRLHRESEFQGTGVGLAIVRRIVDRHGGRIWASSEEGKGARFEFTLPDLESAGASGRP